MAWGNVGVANAHHHDPGSCAVRRFAKPSVEPQIQRVPRHRSGRELASEDFAARST